MATHAAIEVVEQMQVYEDLQTALEPLSYIVGTTPPAWAANDSWLAPRPGWRKNWRPFQRKIG